MSDILIITPRAEGYNAGTICNQYAAHIPPGSIVTVQSQFASLRSRYFDTILIHPDCKVGFFHNARLTGRLNPFGQIRNLPNTPEEQT